MPEPASRHRVRQVVAGVSVVVLLAGIGSTPLGARTAVGAIHAYQHTLGPLLGRAGIRCRFTPTCSHYAAAVIARDGLVSGSLATARRLARCTPWTPLGTIDEP